MAAVDKTASDEMPAILEQQTFSDRIPAGLPPGMLYRASQFATRWASASPVADG
jgi:hypothetical protein